MSGWARPKSSQSCLNALVVNATHKSITEHIVELGAEITIFRQPPQLCHEHRHHLPLSTTTGVELESFNDR